MGAAKKAAYQIGISKKFKIPGDAKFEFGAFFTKAKNNSEKQLFVDYFVQCRHETVNRLIERAYLEDGTQNKHWFQFSKRKFMIAYPCRTVLNECILLFVICDTF